MFGDFPGAVVGLPGLQPKAGMSTAWRDALDTGAQATLAGRFSFLGQSWPPPDPAAGPWWDGDLWLIDPVSGRSWPGADRFAFDVPYRRDHHRGDVKFVWELNRLQLLPSLALQAASAGDDAAAAKVFAVLRGWMVANPPYRGVNWTSGVEAASRMVSVLAGLSFVAPGSPEDRAAVRAFIAAHHHWIARYPSRFSSANNHRVAELAALWLAALCAPGLGRSRPVRVQAALEREILRQFHPDGVGAEQAVAYAAYSLEWFTLAGIAADAARRPFSDAFRERARGAGDSLRWLLDSDGRTPQIGDSDGGRVLALGRAAEPRYAASVAAMTARWLGDPQPPPSQRDPALRDLLCPATPSAPAPKGARTFNEGGLSVWRRPRADGDLLLAFDHGPLGATSIAAHGHADALSIWLHWGGEAVFADPGTYLYHAGGALRDALRATAAHNTLTLEAQDQSRIIGPFAWAEHARHRLLSADDDGVEAQHDGYRRRFGLLHRRRVQVQDGGVLIEDRLIGRRRGLDWSIGFTLGPGVAVQIDGGEATLTTAAGRRLQLDASDRNGAALPWSLLQTPFAPAFGQLQSASHLRLTGTVGAAPLVCTTRIRFGHHDRPT